MCPGKLMIGWLNLNLYTLNENINFFHFRFCRLWKAWFCKERKQKNGQAKLVAACTLHGEGRESRTLLLTCVCVCAAAARRRAASPPPHVSARISIYTDFLIKIVFVVYKSKRIKVKCIVRCKISRGTRWWLYFPAKSRSFWENREINFVFEFSTWRRQFGKKSIWFSKSWGSKT